MSDQRHTQCKLQKGEVFQVAWIPSKHARLGNYVKLRIRGEEWDDGWLVIEAKLSKETEEVMQRAEDYKRQRDASDI